MLTVRGGIFVELVTLVFGSTVRTIVTTGLKIFVSAPKSWLVSPNALYGSSTGEIINLTSLILMRDGVIGAKPLLLVV